MAVKIEGAGSRTGMGQVSKSHPASDNHFPLFLIAVA